MIRVAIAAGDGIVRAGLEALLRGHRELEIAGAFSDPADLPPAVDVLIAAPGDEPAADLLALAADPQAPAVVLILDHPDTEAAADALQSGVRAVLARDAAPAELLAAVEAAAAGLVVLRPSDLQSLLGVPAAPTSADGALSPRELEVLRMLAEGLPNKTIAWKLGISEHTVKFHVASILNRLNAASRAQAVAIGIRRGLILL